MGISCLALGGSSGQAGRCPGATPWSGEAQTGPELPLSGSWVAGPLGCLAPPAGLHLMVRTSHSPVQVREPMTSVQEAPIPSSAGPESQSHGNSCCSCPSPTPALLPGPAPPCAPPVLVPTEGLVLMARRTLTGTLPHPAHPAKCLVNLHFPFPRARSTEAGHSQGPPGCVAAPQRYPWDRCRTHPRWSRTALRSTPASAMAILPLPGDGHFTQLPCPPCVIHTHTHMHIHAHTWIPDLPCV